MENPYDMMDIDDWLDIEAERNNNNNNGEQESDESKEIHFQLLAHSECRQAPVSWDGPADEDGGFNMMKADASECLFGRTEDGKAVTVKARHWPLLVLEVLSREEADWEKVKTFAELFADAQEQEVHTEIRHMHKSDRFHPHLTELRARKFPFVFVWSSTWALHFSLRGKLMMKNPKHDPANWKESKKWLQGSFTLDTGNKSYVSVYLREFEYPETTRFMEANQIVPSSWVAVKNYTNITRDISRDEIQVSVETRPWEREETKDLFASFDRPNAPMLVASWDLEVFAPEGFPQASVPNNIIFLCGVVFWNTKTNERTRYAIVIGPCASVAETQLIVVPDEKSLISEFGKLIRSKNPDVMLGYNTNDFDWTYMNERAKRYSLEEMEAFHYMGRLNKRGKFVNVETETKGGGVKIRKTMDYAGTLINYDLFPYSMANFAGFDSYSLNNVAKNITGHTKVDMKVDTMKAYFTSNEPDKRAEIVKYCIRDCELPLDIIKKKNCLVSLLAMSRVSCTFVDDLLSKGQTVKANTKLFWVGRKENYVIVPAADKDKYLFHDGEEECSDDDEMGDGEEGATRKRKAKHKKGYEGAKVLDAKVGLSEVVAVLDFNSLYPSICQAKNLCSSTFVPDPLSLPAHFTTRAIKIDGDTTHHYVKEVIGLLPIMLTDYLVARKQAREKLEASSDPNEQSNLDAEQKALKISANSVYGFAGGKTEYSCPFVAASITATGREGITLCQDLIEKQMRGPNGERLEVIGGDTDSVFVKLVGAKFADVKTQIFDWMNATADQLNKHFEKPIKIAPEKCYENFLFIAKKRYLGVKHEDAGSGVLDQKASASQTRQYSPGQRRIVGLFERALIIDGDVNKAMAVLKQSLDGMETWDLSDFMLTKKLTGGYRVAAIHTKVAKDSNDRKNGAGWQRGQRVEFVIRKPRYDKEPFNERGVDFELLKEGIVGREVIDTEYYRRILCKALKLIIGSFDVSALNRVDRLFVAAAKREHRHVGLRKIFGTEFVEEELEALAPGLESAQPQTQTTKHVQMSLRGDVAPPPAKKAKKAAPKQKNNKFVQQRLPK